MPRISIGEYSLYNERHGIGFPVLFVSGLGGFGSFWKDQVPTFAKRFEVITFDHRGIGPVSYTHLTLPTICSV